MLVYHGTDLASAQALSTNPGILDVSKGGGELGQGFYTGDHVALAASWARGRDPNGRVLEIDIDVVRYAHLAILNLSWAQVINTWQQLYATGQTRSYTFGYDVVYGPLSTYPHAGQHKFESRRAEDVLKQSTWRMLW